MVNIVSQHAAAAAAAAVNESEYNDCHPQDSRDLEMTNKNTMSQPGRKQV